MGQGGCGGGGRGQGRGRHRGRRDEPGNDSCRREPAPPVPRQTAHVEPLRNISAACGTSETLHESLQLQNAPESIAAHDRISRLVMRQLKAHAPFTLMGTATGVVLMLVILATGASSTLSHKLFWTLHPMHVLLSALVTTAMYELHGRHTMMRMLLIGYLGSVGIATLSDSVMPYVGEWLLDLPNRGIHIGFIEKWWLVNPLALAGILLGRYWPHTRFSHAGHVLLSTWASLFHMTMAFGDSISAGTVFLCGILLFLAVWVPCCTSDIIFPLLFVGPSRSADGPAGGQAR